MVQKFCLGRQFLTRGVNELVAKNLDFAWFVTDCLKRHAAGDWGNLDHEDKNRNEMALEEGSRVFSAYIMEVLPKIWIITEADRSSPTVLFPSEY